MVSGKLENIYLVNAPAGSGKTTRIREMVRDSLERNPENNILCITYTNRAADELKKEVDSRQVWTGTIHSFLNDLVSPYFARKEILDLYFSVFKAEIEKRCTEHERFADSNSKYKEKYGITGSLSIEEVKKHLKKVSYGETQYTAYYYGKLSHDDLIRFSYEMLEKYPAIRQKIAKRFRIIFLDEYQDTDTMVLKIFYEALKDCPDTKLYLWGDKMQQIYSNYDGEFEDKFAIFNTNIQLKRNYRSTPEIINVLNKLYNDEQYSQIVPEEHKTWKGLYKPEIIISDDMEGEIARKRAQMPDLLILYLANSKRFREIDAGNLYNAYSGMDRYSYGKKYAAAKILQEADEECPDAFLRMMFLLNQVLQLYFQRKYGSVIRMIKRNGEIFNRGIYYIEKHTDKAKVRGILDALFEEFHEDISIGEFLCYLKEYKIIKEDYIELIEADADYRRLWNIKLEEVHNLLAYLLNPHVSTQHGVKGESHESVLFVAEDSTSPSVNVRMYKFFELWSKCNFSLPEFEAFYYEYRRDVLELENRVDISKISAAEYRENYREIIDSKVDEIQQKYADCRFFQILSKAEYENYREKRTVASMRACFKKNLNLVYGTLQAYRIFYVGCSRAKKNLTILVQMTAINEFADEFKKKAADTGFEIG